MKIKVRSTGSGTNRKVVTLALAILGVGLMAPAHAADSPTVTPINLVSPSNLPGVAPLPFTGKKSATFSTPQDMVNFDVSPVQGVIGDPITLTGKGLPANATLSLVWSTSDSTWVADVQPNTVNYLGPKYTKYFVDVAKVTTNSAGEFTYQTKAPSDFGGIHDFYLVNEGVGVGHGGYQLLRTLTISPKSGPVGTPITVTYTGLGASLYTAGAAVLWDNSYAGEMQALWTRGTGQVTLRASGNVGQHFVQVADAITFTYMNIMQSPVPYANGGSVAFEVTKAKKNAGLPKAYVSWPAEVEPTVTQRTTLSSVGLDPETKAVATLSKTSGTVGTKTTITATGIPTAGTHTVSWATVVGNRVNCTGTCWAYNAIPLGSVDVVDGKASKEITIPDHLGGWHVIQIKKGEVIEAQAAFYVKESIVPFYDKNGKEIGLGVAKADLRTTPEVLAKGQSGEPSTTFKAGEEFTISIKGVGWTQLDNTLAVTYDNSYIGYGCGFNSNGYMVIHMRATGEPGTHIIDLHPLLYTNQPSFAGTPYGMVPVLSFERDFPGLALGYQIPAFHFAITVTK